MGSIYKKNVWILGWAVLVVFYDEYVMELCDGHVTALPKIQLARSTFFTTKVEHMYLYECYRNTSNVQNFKLKNFNFDRTYFSFFSFVENKNKTFRKFEISNGN